MITFLLALIHFVVTVALHVLQISIKVALQAQDAAEKVSAKSYELQELNNGNKILNTDNYNLPKVNPVLVHSAPDLVDDNGYIKE